MCNLSNYLTNVEAPSSLLLEPGFPDLVLGGIGILVEGSETLFVAQTSSFALSDGYQYKTNMWFLGSRVE